MPRECSSAPTKGKSFEELKKALDAAFKDVNTRNAKDVDAAIDKFKKAVGKPQRTEGGKDFWYGMNKFDNCMEVWTQKGAGRGYGGTDKEKCK